jgi:hypothetical protein
MTRPWVWPPMQCPSSGDRTREEMPMGVLCASWTQGEIPATVSWTAWKHGESPLLGLALEYPRQWGCEWTLPLVHSPLREAEQGCRRRQRTLECLGAHSTPPEQCWWLLSPLPSRLRRHHRQMQQQQQQQQQQRHEYGTQTRWRDLARPYVPDSLGVAKVPGREGAAPDTPQKRMGAPMLH